MKYIGKLLMVWMFISWTAQPDTAGQGVAPTPTGVAVTAQPPSSELFFSTSLKLDLTIKICLWKWKKKKIALNQSQRKIHTVAARPAPGDLGLKSPPKDYQQKLTYWYGHPAKYKPGVDDA